jgi:hypothetical protein
MHRIGDISVGPAILCELVRPEANNKLSILGVFTGDIVIASFPAVTPLSAYLEFLPNRIGRFGFEFRFSAPKGSQSGFKGEIEATALTQFGLPLPTLPINIAEPGALVLELKVDDSDWVKVLEKRVIAGNVA